MNWIINLILWGCVLPVLPIEYFMMRNEVKFKKNIVVGVTLPYEARDHADVKRRLDRYKRELDGVFLLLLAVVIPCSLIQTIDMAMFTWGVWLLLLIVLPNLPYIRCNRDLKEIKLANGWSHQSRDVLWVDTAAMAREKWLSPWLFAPAVLLCLLPIVWDRELTVIYVIDAWGAFGCWAGYRYLYRSRAELVDADRELSKVLSRVRRRNWGKVWLYCAYFMAGISLAMWLLIGQPAMSLMLILALGVLLICAAVRIEFLTRRVQEKLTVESGKAWYADEDDKWIWGLFYYNPNDSRTIINTRVGINSTFNLARSAGKFFAGLTVILLLLIPFMGFLLDGVGSKPLDLQISERVVSASYGSNVYEVAIEDIDTVELLDALPQGMHRVFGTGMENLLKGRFRSAELDNITLCLDPQCPPFLFIKTNGGQQFLFGVRDYGVAEDVLMEILASCGEKNGNG